jgi:two-component system, NtrC family, sensor kinase
MKTVKKREVQPFQVFKEFEDSLSLIQDYDQVIGNFLGKIREICPAEPLILLMVDADTARFESSGPAGAPGGGNRNVVFPRNSRLAKWLKVNRTFLHIPAQPGVMEYLAPAESGILESLGIVIAFPLMSMNRLIGILLVGRKRGGEPLSEDEVAFISSILPQTGIALENALLLKEQRERFRRMSRADRLATIGELAAGAAHEIRNPLTAVKSSLQYLLSKNPDEQARRLLGTALEETARIEGILSDLLSFSRPTEIRREAVDLPVLLEECLELVAFQAKRQKVDIRREFPAMLPALEGDKAQLKQLFLNLFLNAFQAMAGGGRLDLRIESPDGRSALISVADTGEGIAEENLDRIFDPFFTTKKSGTGLGLSICYGIVKSHGGEIEVRSRPGQGTTVLVSLPLSPEKP